MCKLKVAFDEHIFLASQVFSLSLRSLISIVSFVSLYIIHHFSSPYFQCFVFNVQSFEFAVLKYSPPPPPPRYFLYSSSGVSLPSTLDYLIFFTDFWCSILFILHFHAFLKMCFSLSNFYWLIAIFIIFLTMSKPLMCLLKSFFMTIIINFYF